MSKNKDDELGSYLSRGALNLAYIKELIKAGAAPGTFNDKGDNLFHIIIKCQAYSLIPEVTHLGLRVDSKNAANQTALQYVLNALLHTSNDKSAIDELIQGASELIKAGANPVTVDEAGNSFLHHAVFAQKFIHICDAITRGINVNYKNKEGKTPLYYILNQSPINPHVLALVVLAGARISYPGKICERERAHLRNPLRPVLIPAILQEVSLDVVNRKARYANYIDPSDLDMIGKYSDNKERMLHYIDTLPDGMKAIVIRHCKDKERPLGQFFYAKRGATEAHLAAGTLLKLVQMERRLVILHQHSVPVISQSSDFHPSSSGMPVAGAIIYDNLAASSSSFMPMPPPTFTCSNGYSGTLFQPASSYQHVASSVDFVPKPWLSSTMPSAPPL